jgi:hypothetical protein
MWKKLSKLIIKKQSNSDNLSNIICNFVSLGGIIEKVSHNNIKYIFEGVYKNSKIVIEKYNDIEIVIKTDLNNAENFRLCELLKKGY